MYKPITPTQIISFIAPKLFIMITNTKFWIENRYRYLAMTIESIVFFSCGLRSPISVSTLRVTFIIYENIQWVLNLFFFGRGHEIGRGKVEIKCLNLAICNNDQHVILPIAFLNNVNCNLHNRCKRSRSFHIIKHELTRYTSLLQKRIAYKKKMSIIKIIQELSN